MKKSDTPWLIWTREKIVSNCFIYRWSCNNNKSNNHSNTVQLSPLTDYFIVWKRWKSHHFDCIRFACDGFNMMPCNYCHTIRNHRRLPLHFLSFLSYLAPPLSFSRHCNYYFPLEWSSPDNRTEKRNYRCGDIFMNGKRLFFCDRVHSICGWWHTKTVARTEQ